MKKRFILLLFSVVLFSGCDEDSCEDMNCTSPPPDADFELVDKDSGENLFTNGSLDPKDIRLIDENGESVEFRFIEENDLNVIRTGLGWNTETTDYQLLIGEELQIDIVFATEHKTENCCSFFELLEFEIPAYEYEQSISTGITTIFIESESINSSSLLP